MPRDGSGASTVHDGGKRERTDSSSVLVLVPNHCPRFDVLLRTIPTNSRQQAWGVGGCGPTNGRRRTAGVRCSMRRANVTLWCKHAAQMPPRRPDEEGRLRFRGKSAGFGMFQARTGGGLSFPAHRHTHRRGPAFAGPYPQKTAGNGKPSPTPTHTWALSSSGPYSTEATCPRIPSPELGAMSGH